MPEVTKSFISRVNSNISLSFIFSPRLPGSALVAVTPEVPRFGFFALSPSLPFLPFLPFFAAFAPLAAAAPSRTLIGT